MKIFILTIIFSLLAPKSYPVSLDKLEKINLNFGTWLENYKQVRANQSDGTNGFEFNPYISAGLDFKLYEEFALHPEAGWVIQRTTENISKNIFFIRMDGSYALNENIKFKLGSSFVITSISGEGGEDTLNNGDSTETYFIPDERKNALNQTLDLGIEISQGEHGARFHSLIYAWNESDERMMTYTLSYIYKLDFKELR